jgi:hypothetical protein
MDFRRATAFSVREAIYGGCCFAVVCPSKETGRHRADGRQAVKKSLEPDYPPPEAMALRPIHGFATAISTSLLGRANEL